MNLESIGTDNKVMKKYGHAIIVGTSVFFGTIFVLLLIINPLYKKNNTTKAELEQKEKQYSSLVEKKDRMDQLKSKEIELKGQAELVSNALPKEEEIGRVFIQIDALAKASNGSLTSVSKGQGVADAETPTGVTKSFYNLPLQLPTYFDFKNFIVNSKSALRLFSINDFDISASDSGAMTINLTANTYTRN